MTSIYLTIRGQYREIHFTNHHEVDTNIGDIEWWFADGYDTEVTEEEENQIIISIQDYLFGDSDTY